MTAPLWTHDEAVAATGGRSGRAWTAAGVSIDSRTVQPGDLFVALAGPSFDGHDFVAAALAAGAAVAVVQRRPAGVDEDAPLLEVPDTLAALRALAGAARARCDAQVIAVTGSVGKTGTKEMLRLALGSQGHTHASAGNLNNHWGVPLSLARLPRSARFAVFELGMNHAGELAPLSRLVRPDIAVITTVEAVHLEFFASTAEIADAKAEVFEGLGPHGVAVLNRDNPHFQRLAAAAEGRGVGRVLSFGSHIDADARLLDVALDPGQTSVFALIHDQPLAYRLGVPGVQWAMNSLAVLLAVEAAGADVAAAAQALAAMSAPKGRGARHAVRHRGGSFLLIDESYNASPAAMRAAFAALAAAKPAKGARRIAVLGDMLELGEQGPALHKALARPLVDQGVDLVFCAGPLMRRLHQALPADRRGAHAADSEALAPLVTAAVRPGDVVMVKGSAGSRMGRVVEALENLGGRAN